MSILAINTAGPIIEAVIAADKIEYMSAEKVMASEQLLPKIDSMLSKLSMALSDIDNFVCVTGPGSFTGIRIGVNTVRAFAYALKKKVYGVTYSRLLAYNNNVDKTISLIDGGNGVCFAAIYDGEKTVKEPYCLYKSDIPALKIDGYNGIADFKADGFSLYAPNPDSLIKAAEYAIKNAGDTEPLYIRKAQPERRGDDI